MAWGSMPSESKRGVLELQGTFWEEGRREGGEKTGEGSRTRESREERPKCVVAGDVGVSGEGGKRKACCSARDGSKDGPINDGSSMNYGKDKN